MSSSEFKMSSSEFNERLENLRARVNGPADKIHQDDFESWDDVVALFEGYAGAPLVVLSDADIGKVRAKAEKRKSSRVAFRGARLAALRARNRAAPRDSLEVSTRGARLAAQRARRARNLARSVEPGISLGPPERLIVARPFSFDIDASAAKFRRQKFAVGKCVGRELEQVKRAFAFAWVICAAAEQEITKIAEQQDVIDILWHASIDHKEASLSHWFGENLNKNTIRTLVGKIGSILNNWSFAFQFGFRDFGVPVFIRCKSKDPAAGDPPARHLVKNTIELMPRYFKMSPASQAITLLHEMGHRSTSLLRPRDERHDLCTGGWNRKENMCYRNGDEFQSFDDLFVSGNPRKLADASTRGDSGARKVALNNVDNYVCYMWNRFIDHSEDFLEILPPGAKPAFAPPVDPRGKPVG